MKALVLTPLILYSSVGLSREFMLNSDEISIGSLKQIEHNPASETITIIRDKNTPKTVSMAFKFNYMTRICTKYEQERVLVPGYQVCGDANNCHWVPDRYEYRDYCVSHEFVSKGSSQKIKLRFRKAAKLKNGQKESFNIKFNQTQKNSQKINVSGETLNTFYPYDIKKVDSIFRRYGLDFRVEK